MPIIKSYFLPTLFAISLHALVLIFLSDFWGPSPSADAETFRPSVVSAKLITIDRSKTQKKSKPERPKVVINERKASTAPSAPEARRTDISLEEVGLSEVIENLSESTLEQNHKVPEKKEELGESFSNSLSRMLEEEIIDLKAQGDDELARTYRERIYEQVRFNWSRPPSARIGMSARLQVELIPTGEIISVFVSESSGNESFDRSAEQAVRKVRRFDVPADNGLFESHFRRFYLLFKPDDLLR